MQITVLSTGDYLTSSSYSFVCMPVILVYNVGNTIFSHYSFYMHVFSSNPFMTHTHIYIYTILY